MLRSSNPKTQAQGQTPPLKYIHIRLVRPRVGIRSLLTLQSRLRRDRSETPDASPDAFPHLAHHPPSACLALRRRPKSLLSASLDLTAHTAFALRPRGTFAVALDRPPPPLAAQAGSRIRAETYLAAALAGAVPWPRLGRSAGLAGSCLLAGLG